MSTLSRQNVVTTNHLTGDESGRESHLEDGRVREESDEHVVGGGAHFLGHLVAAEAGQESGVQLQAVPNLHEVVAAVVVVLHLRCER